MTIYLQRPLDKVPAQADQQKIIQVKKNQVQSWKHFATWPDQKTMQKHIFNDVVTLCSENGENSRKQGILECLLDIMLHMQALLNCFST